MIYFDNSATTLQKPPEVAEAVSYALKNFGNPGRSFYEPAMLAAHAVYSAREEIALLAGARDPLGVAFTSGATESLNLVLSSLITAKDAVITSVLEHNSVLRPLYNIGCELSFIDCHDDGRLDLSSLDSLVKPNTRFVVCTHGSNLVGSITDAETLRAFCRAQGLTLILDVSQTFGCTLTRADMADVLCFTGHKALFGPQGTGGIIVSNEELDFRLIKTGGSGADSFSAHQQLTMPDVFEAGTLNAHGLHGLRAGAAFINATSIAAIEAKERELTDRFLKGLCALPGITVYGPKPGEPRLPIVALSVAKVAPNDVAVELWENHAIATRAGIHCAPLLHRRLGTAGSGLVRFSLSYFNTAEEIDAALEALEGIVH